MTFVIGDIKHANLVDFLLSRLSHRAPCADGTNRLQRLFGVFFGSSGQKPAAEGNISAMFDLK